MNEFHYTMLIVLPIIIITVRTMILGTQLDESGWGYLVVPYKAKEHFDGKRVRFQSVRISGNQFSCALSIGMNDQVVFLAPCFPLQYYHNAVTIPWNFVSAERNHTSFLYPYRLRIEKAESVYIDITHRQFCRFSDFIPQEQANW